jgi:hypothetical protein
MGLVGRNAERHVVRGLLSRERRNRREREPGE